MTITDHAIDADMVEMPAKRGKAVAKVAPIAKVAPAKVPAETHGDPALVLMERFLTDPSVTPERVNQAFEFYTKLRADAARRAFDAAMADARAEIKPIAKNRLVEHDTKGGGKKSYRHEDLAEISRMVDPPLAKHGLSYRFQTRSNVGEPVFVTCRVTHRDGHFEENTLSGGRDDSGNKSPLQALGSTITYLQRYTLKAALGLAVSSDDNDGAAAAAATASMTTEQMAALHNKLDEMGTDVAAFCNYFKISRIDDLPAADFDRAMTALNRTGKRGVK